jgi:hypothetical protein
MKTITLVLCFAGLLSGCSNDPDTGALPASALPDLTLIECRDMIPAATLAAHQFAIFRNSQGEEKQLELHIREYSGLLRYQHFPYQSEIIQVRYLDRDDDQYLPEIIASNEYQDMETTEEFVRVRVNADINTNFTPTLVLCPELDCPFLEKYFESIEIAGLPFSKVYANYAQPPQLNSFTKVFYTFEEGIVGFEGYDGELWALVRLE